MNNAWGMSKCAVKSSGIIKVRSVITGESGSQREHIWRVREGIQKNKKGGIKEGNSDDDESEEK